MNYLKIYCNLIRKAENRIPPDEYTEKHHTFPKSIFGNNNRIVVLTAREHYIAHALLEKICIQRYGLNSNNSKKMTTAFVLMRYRNEKYNSYLYENSRNRLVFHLQNRIVSEESKVKMSEAKKGENCVWYGKKHSQETKEKIRKAHKGRKRNPFTQEHIEKLRIASTGKTLPEKSRQKIRDSKLGKKRSPETIQKMKENRGDTSGSKNPNSKTWEITFNTEEKLIVNCLFEWAKTNGYNPHRLYGIIAKKQKTHKDIISVQLLTN